MFQAASAKLDRPADVNSGRQPPLNLQIVSAIESQQVLSLTYRGQPLDLEPYVYGRMLSGKDFLFGWQRKGPFSSWRVLWVPLAHGIRVTEQSFDAPRPDYHTSGLAHVVALYAHLPGIEVPPLMVPVAAKASRRGALGTLHTAGEGQS